MSFEEWIDEESVNLDTMELMCKGALEKAYNAGVAAERERCAVKSWSVGMDIAIAEPNINKDPREVGSIIAAAIRRGDG